jgi:hypothetical protein
MQKSVSFLAKSAQKEHANPPPKSYLCSAGDLACGTLPLTVEVRLLRIFT